MTANEQSLLARYSEMETEELLHLHRTSDLTDVALRSLGKVLKDRGVEFDLEEALSNAAAKQVEELKAIEEASKSVKVPGSINIAILFGILTFLAANNGLINGVTAVLITAVATLILGLPLQILKDSRRSLGRFAWWPSVLALVCALAGMAAAAALLPAGPDPSLGRVSAFLFSLAGIYAGGFGVYRNLARKERERRDGGQDDGRTRGV